MVRVVVNGPFLREPEASVRPPERGVHDAKDLEAKAGGLDSGAGTSSPGSHPGDGEFDDDLDDDDEDDDDEDENEEELVEQAGGRER